MAQKLILCEGDFKQDLLVHEPLASIVASGYEVLSVSSFTSQDNRSMCFVLLEQEDPTVSVPMFSLTEGDSTTLSLSCSTTGAKIYYTTNGNTPAATSTEYTNESTITLSATTTVKAIAIKSGLSSEVVTFTYTAASE